MTGTSHLNRPGRRLAGIVGLTLALALTATGCSLGGSGGSAAPTPGGPASRSSKGSPSAPSSTDTTGSPGSSTGSLADGSPCPAAWTCTALDVPLDRRHPSHGTLRLPYGVETDHAAPRGLLLVLAGGPGQAASQLVPRVVENFGPAVMDAYRVVLLDQRGTGAGALSCPRLQREMGYSDLTQPSVGAVRACGRTLGPDRAFYSTDDVVADIDRLRTTLGARAITLEGTSYGTFVAEHYALTYPTHVRALVLDSVVPHRGIDPLDVPAMQRVRRVLRDACQAAHCGTDPVADLGQVIERDHNGPAMLDLLTDLSIVDPTYGPFLRAVHAAAAGNDSELSGLLNGYRNGFHATAAQLSQGLHASALCSDSHFPWGTSAAPLAGRAAAVRRATARYSAADLWPFDAATAAGNGFVRQCQFWPPTPDAPLQRDGDLPDVRTLLLAGTRDLSTPLPWAREELRHAPGGRLVLVPGAGHSTVRQGGVGRDAMRAFLLR